MNDDQWKQLCWKVMEDSADEWTPGDREASFAEGWGLFVSDQSRGLLQSTDVSQADGGNVLTDEEARAIVLAGTDPLHAKALRIVAKVRLLS